MGLMSEEEQKRMAQQEHSKQWGGISQQMNGCNDVATSALRPATDEEIQDMKLRRVMNRLDYHAPNRSQIPRYQAIRDAAKAFVTVIVRSTPAHSDDDEAAIRSVEAAVMMANKSIALEDQPKL